MTGPAAPDEPDAREALSAELGLDVAVVAELSVSECHRISDALARARVRERTALENALDVLIESLPKMLRSTAARILRGR